MLFNPSKEVLDYKGNPILQSEESKESVKVGTLIINALNANYPDDDKLAGSEKMDRFKLCMKMSNFEEFDLLSQELDMIEKYVNKAGFGPLVYGRIMETLLAIKASKAGLM